jgi:predicted CopG family antitoxin
MKHIRITFEDEEMERLMKKKDGKSWHDFIMELAGDDDE